MMSSPVDASAFKGTPPEIAAFRLVTDMRAEEQRKMYTYNMCHAVLGYQGYQDGYQLLVDCLADPKLRAEARRRFERSQQRPPETVWFYSGSDGEMGGRCARPRPTTRPSVIPWFA